MHCLKVIICALCIFSAVTANAADFGGLRDSIGRYISRFDAKVGVAVISDGKDTLTVNNHGRYPLMSVFKFHQALAVCSYMQKNGMPLDSAFPVRKEDLHKDTYSPLRDSLPEGGFTITAAELMRYTLQMSDNNACDILFDRLVSVDDTDAFIRSLGTGDFRIAADENDMHENPSACYLNWTSPYAAASLVEKFLKGNILTGRYHDFVLRTMLECNTGEARLPAPLKGTGSAIGHKTGTSDTGPDGRITAVNDIGFVLLPDGTRYVLAVFVMDSAETFQCTEEIIAGISAIVYNALSSPAL